MKATIYYNDETTTVLDDPEEVVRAHLKRADLRSIARIDIGDKELPDTCVAIADLEEMIALGLRITAESLAPDTCIRAISWSRIAYNVAACTKAEIERRHNESKKS